MSNQHSNDPPMDYIPEASVETGKRFSMVWFVPLVAILIGAWLVYKALSEEGPTIHISFKSADGLEAGKTKIKYKNVEVGQVEFIDLTEDLSGVIVTAKMVKDAEQHLTEHTRFWVVRARIAAGEVSGLGTLFSGAYIGIDPGKEGKFKKDFKGLEIPPVVTTGLPGRHFVLESQTLGSLEVGSPVYFRQINVGQVVGYQLAEEGKGIQIKIFINAPHHKRVSKNTHFWNAGGVHVSIGATGVKVDTQSIVSILSGGIAFETPASSDSIEEAKEGEVFVLYKNREETYEVSYAKKDYWIVNFEGTVRGLAKGAPVEFRGIKIGQVVDIKALVSIDDWKLRIPVLIEVEPERLDVVGAVIPGGRLRDEQTEGRLKFLDTLVEKGLRAQLRPGSLLTGQLYVDLDIFPDAPPGAFVYGGKYPEFPTIPAPLDQIRSTALNLLARLNKFPIEQIGNDLRDTVQGANRLVNSPELRQAIQALDTTLKHTQKLASDVNKNVTPEVTETLKQARKTLASAERLIETTSPVNPELRRALEEIARAARSIRGLADYLERNPNALITGKTARRQ